MRSVTSSHATSSTLFYCPNWRRCQGAGLGATYLCCTCRELCTCLIDLSLCSPDLLITR
jgi:hypothetical protein